MKSVSIIIPIYNIDEKLLRRCIESCLDQTEKDIEIILVDDGSKNNAIEVCRSYEHLENVKVIHQENQGVSVARNAGIEAADAEWVMFVDPDDYIDSAMLEKMLAQSTLSDDIISCCCYMEHGDERKLTEFYPNGFVANDFESKKPIYETLLDNLTLFGAPWAKLFRLKFLNENNLRFFPELRRSQDIIFNLYAMYAARQVCYMNAPLYIYNNDHALTYHDDYKANLAGFYLLFAQARYKWVMTYYPDNDEILLMYCFGAMKILYQILEVGCFHKGNPLSLAERISQGKAISKEDCFKIIFSRYVTLKNMNIKKRIFYFLISHQELFLLYIYHLLASWKKNRRGKNAG